MADDAISLGPSEAGSEIVTLNIPRRDFGQFIQGLLGEPRTIERRYEHKFVIDQPWIQNLDAIIGQRCSQNVSKLIEITAKIRLESGVTKTLNSRAALFAFSDISDSPTDAIDISWVFLIQFPTKKVPERQVIKLRARASHSPKGPNEVFVFDDGFSTEMQARYLLRSSTLN